MEILFDTANLGDIETLSGIYPVTGATCNPTIIKAEGRIDFWEHFRKVRAALGPGRTLHIQVIAAEADGIVREAEKILTTLDDQIYIKIPVTEQGLKAIGVLKKQSVNVTATAIYSKAQGLLAIAAGADYIAPYFNRMESLDIDISATIKSLSKFIERDKSDTQIMAASFKNVAQVSAAFDAGAHAVTVAPSLLRAALSSPDITQAVRAFADDWHETFGIDTLP
ncbi:MAG TPA: fructose-6-phosphate aldolase [Propionibacteriaceae bacterium]|nr:fructose-6-phosphate aldolase [Propionibacteriaceae bacterium]HQE31558.1 fructose-6-phosphate aldolase [Propionibacteriaceae bacterium]